MNLLNLSDLNGHLSTSILLKFIDDAATYWVVVSFEGDNVSNATAYVTTPNGTRYAVCTTVHYGYEPAVNSAAVTVEPAAAPDNCSVKRDSYRRRRRNSTTKKARRATARSRTGGLATNLARVHMVVPIV